MVRTWLAGGEREIKGCSKVMWFKMNSLPESDKEREETIVKQVIDSALLLLPGEVLTIPLAGSVRLCYGN